MSQRLWDLRYLGQANHIASWSKDPSTKVGSVITKDNLPVSNGFNGLPRNVVDTPERLNDREVKYKIILHAEDNAILFAKRDLTGHTIYTWPLPPCAKCTSRIIQAGITRVVTVRSSNERWQDDFALSNQMFKEAGVELVFFDEGEVE